jgi:hypothetical protein
MKNTCFSWIGGGGPDVFPLWHTLFRPHTKMPPLSTGVPEHGFPLVPVSHCVSQAILLATGVEEEEIVIYVDPADNPAVAVP